jgi:dimethylargininase
LIQSAIVRPPPSTFAQGITTANLGPPDVALALEQHEGYVQALERAGARAIRLDPDPAYPDSAFVEDAAFLGDSFAILARSGAPSRRGEVTSVRRALEPLATRVHTIEEPGTLDGGDILETFDRIVIGVSDRTNEEGARQLAAFLAKEGIVSTTLDIRGMPGVLHLKTGISFLGNDRVFAVRQLASAAAALGYVVVPVPEEESYAANSLDVNGNLLIPAGFPRSAALLGDLGHTIVELDMSEFRKMDGGLSCLSLRIML